MTTYEKLMSTDEGRVSLCVEQTITNVTELLCDLLIKHNMKRSELADRVGVTPGRITQLLDGANMTLKSIARAMAAFDCVLEVNCRPVNDLGSKCVWRYHFASPTTYAFSGRPVAQPKSVDEGWQPTLVGDRKAS